jgi:hypothetical protein
MASLGMFELYPINQTFGNWIDELKANDSFKGFKTLTLKLISILEEDSPNLQYVFPTVICGAYKITYKGQSSQCSTLGIPVNYWDQSSMQAAAKYCLGHKFSHSLKGGISIMYDNGIIPTKYKPELPSGHGWSYDLSNETTLTISTLGMIKYLANGIDQPCCYAKAYLEFRAFSQSVKGICNQNALLMAQHNIEKKMRSSLESKLSDVSKENYLLHKCNDRLDECNMQLKNQSKVIDSKVSQMESAQTYILSQIKDKEAKLASIRIRKPFKRLKQKTIQLQALKSDLLEATFADGYHFESLFGDVADYKEPSPDDIPFGKRVEVIVYDYDAINQHRAELHADLKYVYRFFSRLLRIRYDTPMAIAVEK